MTAFGGANWATFSGENTSPGNAFRTPFTILGVIFV
jgi:hypothetical protein